MPSRHGLSSRPERAEPNDPPSAVFLLAEAAFADCVERMMAFCPMPTAGPDPAPAPAPCAPFAHDLATRLQPGPRARGNILQFNNLIHTSGHRESAQESTLDGGDHEGPEGGRRNVARYSLH